MNDVFGGIVEIAGALFAGLRAVVPDRWLWAIAFLGSIVAGIRHVIAHMRAGRVSVGGTVLGVKSPTDSSGASVFRSARSVAHRPSLSPFYGRPAWLRALPYPCLVILAALWIYARPVVILLGAAVLAWAGWKAYAFSTTWRHRRRIVAPMTKALSPVLETRAVEILEGIIVPKNWHHEAAQVVIPLPDHHRQMHIQDAARVVTERLGGEWNHKRTNAAPYLLTLTHKPAPPGYLSAADVADYLTAQGHALTPFLGLGTERSAVRFDFGGQTVHVALSAGTGAGKSTVIRELASQLCFNGIDGGVFLDAKGTSFDGIRHIPGIEIHDDIEDIPSQWDAVSRLREELYARSRGKRAGGSISWAPKFFVLEEFNVMSRLWKKYWAEVKEKGDPANPPVLSDLEDIL
ncbi:hypothetical protein, partial [Micrococcus luteus]|uniref:hypothetical protein n=1 Tax=Micrococcus luteus TaxID=1270 RepID=UPI00331A676C